MKRLIRWLILSGLVLTAACTHKAIAPARPDIQEVLVPVAVPCDVAQIERTPLPSETRPVPNDIFEAVKLALADRSTLKADNVSLRAANTEPCKG